MINKLDWDKSIFFFDVDDTLIDTASNSVVASDSTYQILSQYLDSDKAEQIKNRFNRIFRTLMQGHTAKTDEDWQAIEGGKQYHDNIIERILLLQKPISDKYGAVKKWSREVMLKIAADELQVELTPSVIEESIDAYWTHLSLNSNPMNGVIELFDEIKKHNRPVYLVTSSDARLQLDGDGYFTYDSKHSEDFKIKRLDSLKVKGLNFNAASIGDPEDKPHLDFFEKAIRTAEKNLGQALIHSNIIMFGDSYAGDLQTPREKLGFGLVVLYNKGQKETKEEGEQYISTGTIASVTSYLSETL